MMASPESMLTYMRSENRKIIEDTVTRYRNASEEERRQGLVAITLLKKAGLDWAAEMLTVGGLVVTYEIARRIETERAAPNN
jgi:hypothetical protein